MKTAVVIVAAGRGRRAVSEEAGTAKQYVDLGGETLLARTLSPFQAHKGISSIMVVIHRDDVDLYEKYVPDQKKCAMTFGGKTRQESVFLGLQALRDQKVGADAVLIHDAARPYVSAGLLDRLIAALRYDPAILPALAVADTLKKTDEANVVIDTVDRKDLWLAQTPQAFHFEMIFSTHQKAADAERFDFTDDAAVAEWAGQNVRIVEGQVGNKKVTTAEDLSEAKSHFSKTRFDDLPDIRVGNGFDVHKFCTGDRLWLGGIELQHSQGLDGHSDADVALHALTDAILGALCEGDIGQHFSPKDAQWKDARSFQFVDYAVNRVKDLGGLIAHVDLTILCEAPKIGPHRDAMRARISELCDVDLNRVSVKATTTERLGFLGRGEGLAVSANVTVRLP